MPNIFSKIFTQGSRTRDALSEFSQMIPSGGMTSNEIEGVLQKYALTLNDISKDLNTLVEKFIADNFVRIHSVDDAEKFYNRLQKLISLFGLPENTGKQSIDYLAKEMFENKIQKSIAGGVLSDETGDEIDAFGKALGLEKTVADKIFQDCRTNMVKKRFDEIIADQRLSPEEEENLNKLSKSLSVEVSYDPTTVRLMDRYRLLWQIEHNQIPIIANPGILLQKQEACYYTVFVEWFEIRKQTKGASYGGLTYRKKIAGGLYFRAGSLGIKPMSQDVLTKIDQGTVFITNKRLIFQGAKGNKTVQFNSILDFEPFKNGVQIEKDSGKSPFLKFENDVEIFSAILGQVLTYR